MSLHTAPSDFSVVPAQVWAALNADLQAQVIRLVAQLAFNVLAAHSERLINKEASHALSSDQPQNPA